MKVRITDEELARYDNDLARDLKEARLEIARLKHRLREAAYHIELAAQELKPIALPEDMAVKAIKPAVQELLKRKG